ncbi:hypothetical protein J6A31_05635 [bacterium]|nr:hypothetical protein [bacterium]
MLPSEKHKKRVAEFANEIKQTELSGKGSSVKIIYSKGYSKETEDAIIDIVNGRQSKTKIMIDAFDLAEMIDNVRKYGREGIYMKTESDKDFLDRISKLTDERSL